MIRADRPASNGSQNSARRSTSGVDDIVAAETRDGVVAGAADDDVGALVADDPLGGFVTGEVDRCGVGEEIAVGRPRPEWFSADQLAAESVCLREVRILSGDVMVEDLAAPQCAALILSPSTMSGIPSVKRCFPKAFNTD